MTVRSAADPDAVQRARGEVIEIAEGAEGVRALIEVDVAAVCARCRAGKGCGAGLLSGRSAKRRVEAAVPAGLSLARGDRVEVGLAPDSVLHAAIIVYGLPMLGAAAAAAIAHVLALGDGAAAAAVFAGLVAGAGLGRLRLRREACLRRFVPVVANRLGAAPLRP